MLRNSFKKLMSAALIGVSVFASATLFSACTTSHPEVEMKLSFNGSTYTLEYKLYRKIAPSTVQHFLELVEKGYYDGLCIHDYRPIPRCIRAHILMMRQFRTITDWWKRTTFPRFPHGGLHRRCGTTRKERLPSIPYTENFPITVFR